MYPKLRSCQNRGSSLWTRLLALLSFTLLIAVAPAFAQSSVGTVSGTVLDESQGTYLEGAEVTVEGAAARTSTQRGGAFTLGGVPAGTQTIVVTYPGMSPARQSVTVVAGETASVAVKLGAEVVELAEFNVKGTREGMSQAIAIQKVSIQSKMVAASDQFGEISEGNVGEYLKYLPGVGIDYNANDARGVSLRGLNTAFTVVAVDGTPMAASSSTADTRRFEFEQIAMNNVETTELYKTVTPDIPANSTGGFVNFVTKSAFDRPAASLFTYNLNFVVPSTNFSFGKKGGVWGNQKEYVIRPNLELNYARKIGDKLGLNFNYRFSERYDDSPRTEISWVTATPSSAATSLWNAPRISGYNVRTEQKITHREAFATKLDYHVSDQTKLMLAGQWNWYDLLFEQRGPQFNFGNNTVRTTTSSTNEPLFTTPATGYSIRNDVLFRNKYGTTLHFNGRASHEFSDAQKIWFDGYYSKADGQYRDSHKGFLGAQANLNSSLYTGFALGGVFTQELPTISVFNGATAVPLDTIRSLSNYTLSNSGFSTTVQARPWTTKETKKGLSGHYELRLDIARIPTRLQFGGAADSVHRTIRRLTLNYNVPSTTGTAIDALRDPLFDKDVAFGFGTYQTFDPYKVYDTYKNNLLFVVNDLLREFDEDNKALYVRADFDLTPDLLLIAGARWEERTIDGNAVDAAPRTTNKSKLTTIGLKYDDLYPSLSFKYNPAAHKQIVVRGGVSKTVGHPDYAEVLPSINGESSAGQGNGSISVPDPGLKPYSSLNFDLTFDYYLKNSGVIGVAAFRKNVSDFIVSRNMTAAERATYAAEYGVTPAEFANGSGSVVFNGPKSSVQGIEISYAQNLSFLPKPFNGLNLQANATFTSTDADDNDTLLAQKRGATPKSFNFILGYRYGKWNFTSSTNWAGAMVWSGAVNTEWSTGTANADPNLDTQLVAFKEATSTTNWKLEYTIDPRFSVYFLVQNVFGEGRDDYWRGRLPANANVRLPRNHYQFGEPYWNIGFKGRF